MLDWTWMSEVTQMIDAPLAPVQLAARWRTLAANPLFEEVAGKIELTEWGEILMWQRGYSADGGIRERPPS